MKKAYLHAAEFTQNTRQIEILFYFNTDASVVVMGVIVVCVFLLLSRDWVCCTSCCLAGVQQLSCIWWHRQQRLTLALLSVIVCQ